MARNRKPAHRLADDEALKRRNSAASRAMRRRAARGKGAYAATENTADAPVTDALTDESRTGGLGDEAVATPNVDETPGDEAIADDTVADEAVVDETAVHAPVDDTAVMPPVAPSPADAPAPEPTRATTAWPASSEPISEPVASAAVPSSAAPPTATSPTPTQAGDMYEGTPPDAPKKRRRGWIFPLVLVMLAVLYVGAQALLSSTVPRDTKAMGIVIGGLSVVQAEGEIEELTQALETANLDMRAAEQSFTLPAADAGLDIDAAATVGQVTGFTLMPERLWAHIAGGDEVSPVTVIDDEALAQALETAAAQVDGPAQDAGVTVADGEVRVVAGRSAITVDQEASAALIADQWPAAQTIDLVADIEPPTITDEDADTFAGELESRVFAGPITLEGDDAQAIIQPATIAAHSTVISGSSGLSLDVDGPSLSEAILAANPDLSTDGEDASVSFDVDHEIVIDEGKPGITIDGDRVGDAVKAAARASDRTGDLPYTAADPEVSAEDLGLADFKERVVSFDSPITAERIRTQNLRAAADDVTGTILHPGDTFNLVETLSPITEEEGYGQAHVIVNGILTTGMGGGLSQMATNTYNAAYFAGYELIEHRPHSVWFPRYPAGRESTMYTGSINVVFENNTPYSAILNSYLEDGRLYVDLWSTKHFEVETSASPRSDVRQPGVKEVTAENCEAKGPGQPGFTITNNRTVLLDGTEVDSNSDTWTYRPDDAIKCVSPDDDKET